MTIPYLRVMALFQRAWWLALLSFFATTTAQNFTVRNGQIFTPGFVVLNAPQPNTPLGGGTPTFTSPDHHGH